MHHLSPSPLVGRFRQPSTPVVDGPLGKLPGLLLATMYALLTGREETQHERGTLSLPKSEL